MHLFYLPEIDQKFYFLNSEESKHCIRSLRLKSGDIIYITNGQGFIAEGKIVDDNIKRCKVEIIGKAPIAGEKKNFKLHIAIAPTKSPERFEWFLEKATEIGIDEITPIITLHSEKKSINMGRAQKVVQSAMKQSLRAYLPTIHPLSNFNEIINFPFKCKRYIAHCRSDNLPHLKDIYEPNSDLIILIGPEGDFSEKEIEDAVKKGFKQITLGKSRLRTETAGIVCCSLISLQNMK